MIMLIVIAAIIWWTHPISMSIGLLVFLLIMSWASIIDKFKKGNDKRTNNTKRSDQQDA
jgi:ABC-type transport system involved in cytochrome bd biosynthesis fused ATPase/permease subunit